MDHLGSASNLDEFDPLFHTEGVNVVPVRAPASLADYSAVLLPGSKNTAESLGYLRATGLADEVLAAARRGTIVFGVCGGLQLLGRRVQDPSGVEGGDVEGLGLLDLGTTLGAEKVTRQREARTADGLLVRGYEIHHGRTSAGPCARPYLEDGLGWVQDNVAGAYLHGLFENAAYRLRFLEQLGYVVRDAPDDDWSHVVEAEIQRAARLIPESGWRI